MNPPVQVQIDQLRSLRSGPNSGFDYNITAGGERDNATVVIRIAGSIEYQSARYARNSGFERIDTPEVAAFGKVWDTLNQGLGQLALALERIRLKTIFPSRMTIPTWLMPKRRGISR